MFESLTEQLNLIFKNLRGHGKLSDENIKEALRQVKIALLESDVNFKVVKDFIESIKKEAVGQEVKQSLTPAQQVIKIVHGELVNLMGDRSSGLNLSGSPSVIMLVGLQGSGKTTTAGKLARHLRELNRKPLLVPADVYRPAAIWQLQKLGNDLGIDVFESNPEKKPLMICRESIAKARSDSYNVVIIDTAGRLQTNVELMNELKEIKDNIHPRETILVADAMTGQDAVNIASNFNKELDITGIILSKLDGDARGGAALSIRAVTGKPIKYVGIGEKPDALEVFHPDRMASRIMGMGDILTLIEKTESAFDEKKALEMERKIRKNAFTLEDFRDQLVQVRKMGSLEQIVKMIPGLDTKALKNTQPSEKELIKIEAIINSMTKKERQNHSIINGSRRRRIAKGSGTKVEDINRLLKQYGHALKLMKKLNKGFKGARGFKGMGNISNLFNV
ncbi:MAG: signal recognition particle protein [Thermodesulfobacteriota bacterium]|nr:signal recognition particle protein [Thermodesulfobacteriota bacterium]